LSNLSYVVRKTLKQANYHNQIERSSVYGSWQSSPAGWQLICRGASMPAIIGVVRLFIHVPHVPGEVAGPGATELIARLTARPLDRLS